MSETLLQNEIAELANKIKGAADQLATAPNKHDAKAHLLAIFVAAHELSDLVSRLP